MGIGRFDTHRTLAHSIMIVATLLFVFLASFFAAQNAAANSGNPNYLAPDVPKGIVQTTAILFVIIVLSMLHIIVAGYDYGEWGLGHYHTAWTHLSGFVLLCNSGLLIAALCVIFRKIVCAQVQWGYQCHEISSGVIATIIVLGVIGWLINVMAAVNYAKAPHNTSPHHHSHIAIPSAPASHV